MWPSLNEDSLLKYEIITSQDIFLPFSFNYTPISCQFWKVYELEITDRVTGLNVSTNTCVGCTTHWIEFDNAME